MNAARHHCTVRRRRFQTALTGLLAATIVMLAASAAHATIVVGSGIAGVRIGASQAQVRSALGAPSQLYCWSGTGPACPWQEANYRHAPVAQVLFSKAGRVIDMIASQGNQRTSSGIKVGSSLGRVRRAYAAIACAAQECVLVSRQAGSTVATTFFLAHGKVAAVEVAQADTVTLTLSPSSLAASTGSSFTTATVSVTDAAGDPEIGAVPELTVSASAGNHIGSITASGGVTSGRYTVQISASPRRGPVTITATFHWGPPALRRVLGVSSSTVLRQL